MSSKSKRLGTLADVFQAEKLDGTIRKINIGKITPSENQPRQDRRKGIEDLARSLADNGLLQPIVVTKSSSGEDSYKIIAGERRYHAAMSLEWPEIECKILHKDEKDTYKLAIIENLQRENLSPFEEIDAIIQLKKHFHYTDADLGDLLGKSRSYTTEMLSIASMTKEDLRRCRESGIDNKNLLVQAAQSAKKGLLSEFLNKLHSGELKTVKDAKIFNKKEDSRKPTPTPANTLFAEKAKIRIVKKDNSVSISADSDSINEIYQIVKKALADKFTT